MKDCHLMIQNQNNDYNGIETKETIISLIAKATTKNVRGTSPTHQSGDVHNELLNYGQL